MLIYIAHKVKSSTKRTSECRYADRAKKIKNHAVVNEDPNAKLIAELRAEVEQLKNLLLNASLSDALTDKLEENEKLMKEMSMTKDEKLAISGQKQVENRQMLESFGLNCSFAQKDSSKFFLVNLNSDPNLSELLVYYLKDVTRVGTFEASVIQDIQLTGSGICEEHCTLEIIEDQLYIIPMTNAKTFVNGREVKAKMKIWDGDRILWGTNHFFRVNCPTQQGNFFIYFMNDTFETFQQ